MARALRIVLPAVLGVVAFAIGYVWQAAPIYAASVLHDALVKRADRRGIDLQIGEVWADPTDRVVLADLVIRDKAHPEPPIARVARIDIDFEIDGFLQPKVFLQRISVRQPQLHVSRDAQGHVNIQAILDRLLRPKADDDEPGSGGWRKYLSKHVPPIALRGTELAIDDLAGAPIQLGALDARHLRLEAGAVDIANESAVQEKLRLRATASVRVRGLNQPLRLDATLQWPDKQGEVVVSLPTDVSLAVGGWRVRVGKLSLRSDGEAALGNVRVVRTGDNGVFGLDVREIAAKLSQQPGVAIELPEALAAKLPNAAKQLLRHVTEVVVRDPVIVARRQARPADQVQDDDDDDGKTDLTVDPLKGAEGGDKGAKKGKGKEPKPAKDEKEVKKADPGDGSAVRMWISELFGKGADKLQTQVEKLRGAMASVPVPLVVVEHGSARFDDQRLGAAREVSDFSARVQRAPGDAMVTLAVAFHVPGREAQNQVSGKFDVRTGDGEVKVQLDDLPLQPYAALLPSNWVLSDKSAIQRSNLTVLVNAGGGTAAGKLTLEGKGSVSDVSIDSARLSKQRIEHVTALASGKLDLDLAGQRIELANGHLEVGRVQVEVAGSVDKFRSAPHFKMHLAVPTVACQDVVDAVPVGFANTLAGMHCDGRLSYEFKGSLDTANMDSLEFEFKPMLGEVRITTLGPNVDFSKFEGEFVHQAVRYIRHPKPNEPPFNVMRFQTGPGSPNWVPYEHVSSKFIDVITTTEDGGFFGHSGFLTEAIKSAAIANLKKGRFVRGASTITQQLIKNLFFMQREKTISRKLQEAVVTWYAENSNVLGATKAERKHRMMELYLNIIELGPDDIYGIGAASWKYFSRPPGQLTLLQALWLGSIIPSPAGYFGEFLAGKATDNHRGMLCWVADVMAKRLKITAEERERLGDCTVVFGGAADGSEEPPPEGLGHEGDIELDGDGQPVPKPPGPPPKPTGPAPSVDPGQQP